MVDRSEDAVGMGPNSGYDNYGNRRQPGIVDRGKDAIGMGPNDRRNETGYGAQGYNQPRQEGIVDRAKDAVGMGPNNNCYDQPGYDNHGNRRQEGIVDRTKDAIGMGPDDRRNEQGYGTQGFNQPRQEGIVDRAKDAVGMGPNNNRYDQPGYDNYGNRRQEGIVDRTKDAIGMGPNDRRNEQGYGTQGYSQPRQEGIVHRAKDAVGMGPNVRRNEQGYGTQGYNPNREHPSEETGFGGGLGYDQSQNLGTGYENRMATGADAYSQPGEGYDERTRTGVDAYVHGNHPAGMQDRITGVKEPSILDPSLMNLPHGQHVPENALGERRTEPGYDMSTGHRADYFDGDRTTGTGVGHRDIDYDENRGKRVGDASAHDTKTGTDYDKTETGCSDDTTGVHDVGSAPPKKGFMTKIKEKIHHTN
jgi:hypothetical protein